MHRFLYTEGKNNENNCCCFQLFSSRWPVSIQLSEKISNVLFACSQLCLGQVTPHLLTIVIVINNKNNKLSILMVSLLSYKQKTGPLLPSLTESERILFVKVCFFFIIEDFLQKICIEIQCQVLVCLQMFLSFLKNGRP